jgi:hypothetical protein
MRRLSLAILIAHLCAPNFAHGQKLTDASDGTLNLVVSFAVTPGASNSPASQTVNFRLRCRMATGYQVEASAVYAMVGSVPDDGGHAIAASDIGVGITAIDASQAEVIKPRTDTIVSGFDYDPAAVIGSNGLTPYTGKANGLATIADLVDSPSTTILTGPQIAADENTSGTPNFLTVTMTFALVPQYFTPGTFTAVITLTTTQQNPEHLIAVNPNRVDYYEKESTDQLRNGCTDVVSIRPNRVCPDDGDHNG